MARLCRQKLKSDIESTDFFPYAFRHGKSVSRSHIYVEIGFPSSGFLRFFLFVCLFTFVQEKARIHSDDP